MSAEPGGLEVQPIARCEYQITDDLAARAALALLDAKAPRAMRPMDWLRIGLFLAISAQLLAAIGACLDWFAPHKPLTQVLMPLVAAVLVLLLLQLTWYGLPRLVRWLVRWRAVRSVRKLADRHVRWTFFADRLETQSALNQRQIPWTAVTRVRVMPEFCILTLASGPVLFFPDTALLPEARALLERQAREPATTGGRQTMNARDNPFADDDPGSGASPFGTHDQVICCKCGGSVPREDATFKVKSGPSWWSILFWGPIWSMILSDDKQHRGYYCPLCLRLFQQAEQRRKVYCAVACVVIVVVIILLEFIH